MNREIRNTVKVKFKKLRDNAVIPSVGSDLAAGWDVTVSEIEEKEDGTICCKLGFALEVPPTHKVLLYPRSSISKTGWMLANSVGIADPDYRGEYMMVFNKVGVNEEFPYKVGDRCGQLVLSEVINFEFIEEAELTETERGVGGFGSTDKITFNNKTYGPK